MVAFVPPGHPCPSCPPSAPARPPTRSVAADPTRRAHPVKVTPSGRSLRSLPPVAPYDGAPRPPGGRVAHRAELVAPPRGPHGSPLLLCCGSLLTPQVVRDAWRGVEDGMSLVRSAKTVTLVLLSTTPPGIEQAHPLVG